MKYIIIIAILIIIATIFLVPLTENYENINNIEGLEGLNGLDALEGLVNPYCPCGGTYYPGRPNPYGFMFYTRNHCDGLGGDYEELYNDSKYGWCMPFSKYCNRDMFEKKSIGNI